MGFLDRAIRRGISEGVGKAVGSAISKAVEPAATNLANSAARQLDSAGQNAARQVSRSTSELDSAMANFERAAQNYATSAAKNMKICPQCETPSPADKKFCTNCGAKLPEETLAQGAVCTACGTQNPIGTRFCQECGTKLPGAIREEQAAAAKDAAVLAEWDAKLSAYPKWNCGGKNYHIEQYEADQFIFSADFGGDHFAAQQAVQQYRQLLLQCGFRQAGQYPSREHLYKMENGICWHVDTEHCFEGDADCPSIGFLTGEPTGGFNYVKPEPKKPASFRDLFNF